MSLNAKQKKFINQLLWLVAWDIFLESVLPIIAGMPVGYVMVAVLSRVVIYHVIAYSIYLYIYESIKKATSNISAVIGCVVLSAFVIIWILLFIRIMYYGDYNELGPFYRTHGNNGFFLFLRIYFTHNSSILSALLLFPAHHLIRILLARRNMVN